ncbi:Basic leucine zipper 23 [Camellia lanceoleosa]|uniref:Basic leucine zipper 23 n=1 Tax=Camellia lanceoleosa TaxID=1840588 RepID=A0ACC0IHX2_9ERIC|nr:Basic leucine zipper 23 [Camellia lanceoleosa]
MDDGEIDYSNQEMFSSLNIDELRSCFFTVSDLDEFMKETCTHAHTCNPPGPDSSHTHTCHHVHAKILPAATQDKVASIDDIAESSEKKSKKCPMGNREAVRKYREKKKARTASLEDEVVGLRAKNQQLVKTLQDRDAEIGRLKCLLVDFRGRIDGEIGSIPYQNLATPNMPGAFVINPCNQVYCLQPGAERKSGEDSSMNGQGFGCCEFANLQCLGNQNAGPKKFPGCGLGNVASTVKSSVCKCLLHICDDDGSSIGQQLHGTVNREQSSEKTSEVEASVDREVEHSNEVAVNDRHDGGGCAKEDGVDGSATPSVVPETACRDLGNPNNKLACNDALEVSLGIAQTSGPLHTGPLHQLYRSPQGRNEVDNHDTISILAQIHDRVAVKSGAGVERRRDRLVSPNVQNTVRRTRRRKKMSKIEMNVIRRLARGAKISKIRGSMPVGSWHRGVLFRVALNVIPSSLSGRQDNDRKKLLVSEA